MSSKEVPDLECDGICSEVLSNEFSRGRVNLFSARRRTGMRSYRNAVLMSIVLLLTSFSAYSQKLCPDGRYHANGVCKVCPDGSYTTAPKCTVAPNGTYQPDYGKGTKVTPKGTYIPNTGHQVLCPDGNYYAGKRCKVLPDGRYIGVQ